MKTLFESGRLSLSTAAPMLMELGSAYCILSKMDAENGAPHFARLWSFAETDLEESLKQIVAIIKEDPQQEQELVVSVAFPQTVLLPEGNKRNHGQLLQALFPGTTGDAMFYSNGKNFAFTVPYAAQQVLGNNFPSITYLPAHACIPAAGSEGNSIHVFFVDHQIRVTVYKQQQLQLVQQYNFGVPLDVVYYLLKICTEFGHSQQETLLSVSGFIEADSPLYKELHQYFLNIRFSQLQAVTIEGQQVPAYYFSSLYNLAQCAL